MVLNLAYILCQIDAAKWSNILFTWHCGAISSQSYPIHYSEVVPLASLNIICNLDERGWLNSSQPGDWPCKMDMCKVSNCLSV